MSDSVVGSVGDKLQSARKSKNLTIQAAHNATKIAVHVLNKLEQDDFSSFESDIYLKGFLKSYAKYLELDSDDLLKMLERQRGSAERNQDTLWDIEDTVVEEKIKPTRVFRRFVLPLLILIILVLSFLLIRERAEGKDLTIDDSRVYLESEVV